MCPAAAAVQQLLMMGGVSPETCGGSYKCEINFDTLLHLVGFFNKNYDDNQLLSLVLSRQ
jgi:hypothetical protein